MVTYLLHLVCLATFDGELGGAVVDGAAGHVPNLADKYDMLPENFAAGDEAQHGFGRPETTPHTDPGRTHDALTALTLAAVHLAARDPNACDARAQDK